MREWGEESMGDTVCESLILVSGHVTRNDNAVQMLSTLDLAFVGMELGYFSIEVHFLFISF